MNNARPVLLPKARKDKLIIKELPDETLVYDRDTDEAHCLNLTATRIWKHCDGHKTVEQLRELMEKENSQPIPEEVIWLALHQLEKFRLLEDASSKAFDLPGMTRRDLVRRVGIATLALPLIVSISTSPAHAQGSLLPPNRCCQNPTDCASGTCAQNPACVPPPPAAPSTKACT